MAASDYTHLQEQTVALVTWYQNNGECILRDIRAHVEFKIYRPQTPHPFNIFSGAKVINSPRAKIDDFLWNKLSFCKIKEYDPDCIHWDFKPIDPRHRIVHQINKLGWPLWNRSFVSLWWRVELEDRTLFYHAGTTDPSYPESPTGDVRGTVIFSVIELMDIGLTQTRVTRMSHLDPAGSIPSPVVNAAAGRQMVGFINWLETKVRTDSSLHQ
jgi:hypothetical protein